MMRLASLLLCTCMAALMVPPAGGQPVPLAENAACAEAGEIGRAARVAERRDWAATVRLLEPIVEAEPGCYKAAHGSAAYWLALAYAEQGEYDAVFRVGRAASEALMQRGARDLRLEDLLIQHLVREGGPEAMPEAQARYYALLRDAYSTLEPWEGGVAERHLAQVLPLLGAEQRNRLSLRTAERSGTAENRAQELIAWWEHQNPLPASGENERVQEHLVRVSHAQRAYRYDQAQAGYDSRGEVYVRYGEPHKRYQIMYNDFRFLREVFRFGVNVARGDFPDHEIWNYLHGGEEHSFVFVKEREDFRLGSTQDLLPSSLRQGFNHSERGLSRAASALAAMRWIYENIAMHSSGYANIYETISAYDARQDALRSIDDIAATRQAGQGTGIGGLDNIEFRAVGGRHDWPDTFVRRILNQITVQDREVEQRRSANMPTLLSRLEGARGLELAPVGVARLRGTGDETRVIVFWRDDTATLENVRRTGAQGVRQRARVAVRAGEDGPRSVVVDTTYAGSAGEGRDRRAELRIEEVQAESWLQVDLLASGEEVRVGAGAATLGALSPLRHEPEAMEVSDLIPFEVDDLAFARTRQRDGFTLAEVTLMPERSLAGREALGVYLEVYTQPGREADLFITYEVVRRRQGGILRRTQTETSVFPFRRDTFEPRLPAAFLIDRTAWQDADEIDVVITVLDGETGEEVVRSLRYRVE